MPNPRDRPVGGSALAGEADRSVRMRRDIQVCPRLSDYYRKPFVLPRNLQTAPTPCPSGRGSGELRARSSISAVLRPHLDRVVVTSPARSRKEGCRHTSQSSASQVVTSEVADTQE